MWCFKMVINALPASESLGGLSKMQIPGPPPQAFKIEVDENSGIHI